MVINATKEKLVSLERVEELPKDTQGILVWTYAGKVWAYTVKLEGDQYLYYSDYNSRWTILELSESIIDLTLYIIKEEEK